MSRILVIFTGGTIASGLNGGTRSPDTDTADRLRVSLDEVLGGCGVETVYRQPLGWPGIDSSEMDPGHWLAISRCIADELENGLSGVLILHGTDTMANTAAWLSLCFGRLPIPVILTGSQLTLDLMTEDATANLRAAAMACCSELNGVWVSFNWKLIPGDRAHKAHAMHPDAFTAINGQPIYFNPDWALQNAAERRADSACLLWETGRLLRSDPDELRRRCAAVRWHFAQPGGEPQWRNGDLIICLLGYGAGNISPRVLDGLKAFYEGERRPEIIACSQAEGGMKNPGGYSRVGMSTLARDGFRVWNQMDHSVEFINSLCCYAIGVAPDAPEKILARYLKRCAE